LNKEIWMVLLPAFGWLLFALGGTQISDKIAGQKWTQRFLLPAIFALCIFLARYVWWQYISVAMLACLMFHLGYGSKTSWKIRLLVFTGYGLISAPIGLSFWNLITSMACAVMFLLSNTKFTAKIFVWKIVEGFFGLLIAIQISYIMAGYGLIWIKK
jgi:hypothetical protein